MMVQSLEASESKSNGCHFYSFLNGFTNIGHVKSICKIAPILRLIDFLTIDVSSENLFVVQFDFFWVLYVMRQSCQMLIESLIPPVQSLLSSFIFIFLTLFCFTGFSSVLVKLPPFSVKEEDRLYFPIIQGTS